MPTIGSENWFGGELRSRRRDPRGCSATVGAATAFGRQATLRGAATGAIDAARAWALMEHGVEAQSAQMEALRATVAGMARIDTGTAEATRAYRLP